MAKNTVTAIEDLIAHQRTPHGTGISVIGAARLVPAGSIAARIWVYHGFTEATINTNPGTFLIQTRGEAVNDQWATVLPIGTFGGTPATSDLTATEPIGETALAITSSAAFAALDYIYITDATDDENDEWHTISEIGSGTNITLAEGLVFEKESGDDAFTGAQMIPLEISLRGVFEYRAIYVHQGAIAADTAIWVRRRETTDFS